ncbi:hypothetical protein FB645_006229, partial [Coemansia sp. IMI 203386]
QYGSQVDVPLMCPLYPADPEPKLKPKLKPMLEPELLLAPKDLIKGMLIITAIFLGAIIILGTVYLAARLIQGVVNLFNVCTAAAKRAVVGVFGRLSAPKLAAAIWLAAYLVHLRHSIEYLTTFNIGAVGAARMETGNDDGGSGLAEAAKCMVRATAIGKLLHKPVVGFEASGAPAGDAKVMNIAPEKPAAKPKAAESEAPMSAKRRGKAVAVYPPVAKHYTGAGFGTDLEVADDGDWCCSCCN